MKSKTYLIDKLQKLSEKFNNLSFKYQHDSYNQAHIIEVKPLYNFNNDLDYADCESQLTFAFDQLFFPESVLFISEESLTQITDPEFELNPHSYILNVPVLKGFDFGGILTKDYSSQLFDYRLAA